MRKRIAILLHKAQEERSLGNYLISHLAQLWRDQGLEVIFLSGTGYFVPADVIIVHVDLSVLPDEYLDLAKQYPVALNGEMKDIRKSVISTQRLTTISGYDGKVIVKSNLDHGGVPDQKLNRLSEHRGVCRQLLVRLEGRLAEFNGRLNYRIYDHICHVPSRILARDDFIVEKFLPEFEDGKYHVRQFEFLGDHFICLRLASTHPVIRSRRASEAKVVEPHPALFGMRRRLKLDYGKLEYVVHNDQAVLLDVEKTNVVRSLPISSGLTTNLRHHWARAIYDYLR